MSALATFEATAAAIATLGISVLCGMFLLRAALRVLERMVSTESAYVPRGELVDFDRASNGRRGADAPLEQAA